MWVGDAKSLGASSDLRVVLDYLLVADFQEFGKNTGKAITVDLKQNDPAVYSLHPLTGAADRITIEQFCHRAAGFFPAASLAG